MDLPPEVLFNIFIYLNEQDLINCISVCKRWSRVAKDDLLWKALFFELFNLHVTTSVKTPNSTSWRAKYIKLQKKGHDFISLMKHSHSHLEFELPLGITSWQEWWLSKLSLKVDHQVGCLLHFHRV